MATQQTFGFLQTPSFGKDRVQRLQPAPSLPASAPARPNTKQPPSEQPIAEQGPSEPLAAPSPPAGDRASVLRQLRAQVGCVTTAAAEPSEKFSTGSAAVDRLLPRGGLRIDAITEWVAEADGCGAASLSIIAAATHMRSMAGPLLVVGGPGTFYPPAAVALGVPTERIIWVRPTRHADVIWAIDQALRCESVAAVWAHLGPNLDDRDARRFQLAAEIGKTPGLFVRPSAVRGRPSFAEVRFHVAGENVAGENPGVNVGEKRNRVMRLTLDRCRGGTVGQSIFVGIDDQARVQKIASSQPGTSLPAHSIESTNHETATLRLASELAHPTSAKSTRQRRRA